MNAASSITLGGKPCGMHTAIRVHQIAQHAGVSSRDVLAALWQLGVPARSASTRIAAQNAIRAIAQVELSPHDRSLAVLRAVLSVRVR